MGSKLNLSVTRSYLTSVPWPPPGQRPLELLLPSTSHTQGGRGRGRIDTIVTEGEIYLGQGKKRKLKNYKIPPIKSYLWLILISVYA